MLDEVPEEKKERPSQLGHHEDARGCQNKSGTSVSECPLPVQQNCHTNAGKHTSGRPVQI